MEQTMTIGAFARRTGLSVSALRFYAARGLLEPVDVDSGNRYRRYAANQIADGELVRDLRRLHMSLADIEVALRADDAERSALVAEHLHELEMVVRRATVVAQEMGVETDEETSRMTNKPKTNTPNTNTRNTNTLTKSDDAGRPRATQPDREPSVTIDGAELSMALGQVLHAASDDPEFPHLMGVLFEAKDASLRLVTTDRHRLAVRDLVPQSLDGAFSAVVASATLQRWLEPLSVAGSVTLHLDANTLLATSAGGELSARNLPVTFPDYEQHLASDERAASAVIDRDALLAALAHGANHVEDNGMRTELIIAIGADGLEMASDGQRQTIPVTRSGPAARFVIDRGYMHDAAVKAIGPEVVIEAGGPLAPVLFRSADDGTYTSLVMPVKR